MAQHCMAKTPLGRLPAEAFGMLELPRLAAGILEGFRALGDLTGTTSDALDQCRIAGAVPGSILKATDPGARVSACVGKRQGEAGAIVDGAVRDIDHGRKIGYPIWCSSVSPVTGKWRIQTVAVNRPVGIAVAQGLAAAESERLKKLAAGIALADWIRPS